MTNDLMYQKPKYLQIYQLQQSITMEMYLQSS